MSLSLQALEVYMNALSDQLTRSQKLEDTNQQKDADAISSEWADGNAMTTLYLNADTFVKS